MRSVNLFRKTHKFCLANRWGLGFKGANNNIYKIRICSTTTKTATTTTTTTTTTAAAAAAAATTKITAFQNSNSKIKIIIDIFCVYFHLFFF